ncbi:hypothetical protein HDU98_009468 [Podochytrium sp. JEL0797]|nr:hypothetical protein HDU98_009468 [Podochytrium sp. JEL0797]
MFKAKYPDPDEAIGATGSPSIESVQNAIFERLSQKKHMLVQANKNRKKSSKFSFLDPIARPRTHSVNGSSRLSVTAMSEVASEFKFEFDNADDSSEDESVDNEPSIPTMSVIDTEELDPDSIHLVNLVQEMVKTGRRGAAILGTPPAAAFEKWEPLRLSALNDFRKTIIPTALKAGPRISDIAVAVEEKFSLPNLMRVWVTPEITD